MSDERVLFGPIFPCKKNEIDIGRNFTYFTVHFLEIVVNPQLVAFRIRAVAAGIPHGGLMRLR